MKKQHLVLLSTILVSSAVFVLYQVKDGLVIINGTSDSQAANKNQEKTVAEITLKKLSILSNRCRGCGKCTKVDPSHFEISASTQKAMIISTDNLNSTALIQAINICTERAIVLE